MDIIDLMLAGHRSVIGVVDDLACEPAPAVRRALLSRLCVMLRANVNLEEQIFYPEFRRFARSPEDFDLFLEALEGHCEAAEIRLDALASSDPEHAGFAERLVDLRESLQSHHAWEAARIFPRARRMVPAARLRDLAKRAALIPGAGRAPRRLAA
jgi:hypothetical protein